MDDVAQTDAAPRRGLFTWKLFAAIVTFGPALAGLEYFVVGPQFPFIDNAIRLLVAEGILLVAAAAATFVGLRASKVGRRGRRAVAVVAIAVVVVAAAVFEPTWGGDMQQGVALRQWVRRLARSAGIDVGDVIHASQLADPPLTITPGDDDFPGFLGGAARLPVAHLHRGKLARDWSQRPPREVWRTKIGDGWSSFAVVDHYGFTQEQTTDERFEQVTCYDLADGKLRWVHADEGGYSWSLGGKGPRATPTYFGGRILSQGSNGLLNCLDAATGRRLWSHDLVAELDADVAMWGKSTSPLVITTAKHGEIVVVGAGVKEGAESSAGASLIAYKSADGAEVWRAGTFASGYCSPQLSTLGGMPQILISHWQTVAGHDPETGQVLWTFDNWDKGQPKVPQPLVIDDRRVLVSAGYGVGCRMLEVVRDAGGAWNVKELWKSNRLKPKFTNLAARDGHVYGLDDGEFLACLDLADGKLKWRSPRSAHFGHGQVLMVDDLLLVQTEDGELVLAAADPSEYRELGRVPILPVGTSWNTPALWGKHLLVRNDEEAALFELPTEP